MINKKELIGVATVLAAGLWVIAIVAFALSQELVFLGYAGILAAEIVLFNRIGDQL